jgi:nucleoside-triphosphatase THEP1
MSQKASRIWIITGHLLAGKTHFCTQLINQAKAEGLFVAGLICPPLFTGQQKTGILVEDLKNNVQKTLATLRTNETDGLLTDHWVFDEEVLAWGNQVLADTGGCDLLLVDELGPLEFEWQKGWQNGLHAIDKSDYKIAVVVIRPALVDRALGRWPHAQVIEIAPELTPEKTKILVKNILCDK